MTDLAPAGRAEPPEHVERRLMQAWDARDKVALDACLGPLARRTASGDVVATEQLLGFLHRTGAVRRIVQRYVADREVDDVEQRTLIAVHRSVGRFEGRSRFMTWLHSVAVNTALTERRTVARRREVVVDESPEPGDHSGRISSMVARRADLTAAFDLLTPEQREAVALWEDGHTYEEIATFTGVAVGTVRSRISRARERLRTLTAAADDDGAR